MPRGPEPRPAADERPAAGGKKSLSRPEICSRSAPERGRKSRSARRPRSGADSSRPPKGETEISCRNRHSPRSRTEHHEEEWPTESW
jgi:hypothetical protein